MKQVSCPVALLDDIHRKFHGKLVCPELYSNVIEYASSLLPGQYSISYDSVNSKLKITVVPSDERIFLLWQLRGD